MSKCYEYEYCPYFVSTVIVELAMVILFVFDIIICSHISKQKHACCHFESLYSRCCFYAYPVIN